MDNIKILQSQRVKIVKNAIIVADVSVILLIALLAMAGGADVITSTPGAWILIVAVIMVNFLMIKAGVPDETLKNLPPDALVSADRECMKGIRFSNGILCESGVLLIVGMGMDMNVKAVLCRDIMRLSRDIMGGMDRIIVTDTKGKLYQIGKSNQSVRGNGTFWEMDADAFWAELNGAKERFAVSDPKQNSASQNDVL